MVDDEHDDGVAEEEAMDNANVLNPIIGIGIDDIKSAGISVAKQALIRPLAGLQQAASLIAENVKIVAGTSKLAPNAKDRRFKDDAFDDSPIYRRVAQSWLALERSLSEWVDSAEFEESDRDRAKFFTQLIADAIAPTNFLMGNPSALRKAKETKGMSLVQGVENLAHDWLHNDGMPTQVDSTPFVVGENLATTTGSVVFEHPVLELIQYAPTTKNVRARPVLVVPPQINKFYVYDLTPEKSIVKYLLDQGFQVFVVSWRNPTAEQREWGLDEYTKAIEEAIDSICTITRHPCVDTVGACAGGITLTATLAYMAAVDKGDAVASMTLMVNVLDPRSQDTVANLFMTDEIIETSRKRTASTGILDGRDTARVFSWMRPNDLIWNYVASNYLHGDTPPAFDVLFWNSDTTRLPASLHSDFLDVFKNSPFRNAGSLSIRGVEIDVGKISCPIYIMAGSTDHITPWSACYRSTQLFSGDVTFVLSSSGHIQSLINPPNSSKRIYWTNSEISVDHGDWLKGAEEQGGSWWPHWSDWLLAEDAEQKTAPKKCGNKKFSPLRPAPGDYVFE